MCFNNPLFTFEISVSVSVDNLSCQNSINMSNEVFESVEEQDPLSSRTVSADKISTITEVSIRV